MPRISKEASDILALRSRKRTVPMKAQPDPVIAEDADEDEAAVAPQIKSGKKATMAMKAGKLRNRFSHLAFDIADDGEGVFHVVCLARNGDQPLGSEITAALEKDGVEIRWVDADQTEQGSAAAPLSKEEKKALKAKDKEAEKASKAAAKAAKAKEKTDKPARQPAASSWTESFARSIEKKAALASEGKPLFRPGSKRQLLADMLIEGTTLEAAMEATGWNRPTVSSGFQEMKALTGKQLHKEQRGETYVYSLR